jgi:hypothetical protein
MSVRRVLRRCDIPKVVAVTRVEKFEDCTLKLEIVIKNFYKLGIECITMMLDTFFNFWVIKLME